MPLPEKSSAKSMPLTAVDPAEEYYHSKYGHKQHLPADHRYAPGAPLSRPTTTGQPTAPRTWQYRVAQEILTDSVKALKEYRVLLIKHSIVIFTSVAEWTLSVSPFNGHFWVDLG